MGTVNRVAFLGDPYLELIGVIDPGLADEWPIGRAALRTLERGGGLATYGLVEDELEAAVSAPTVNWSSGGAPAHRSSGRIGLRS